MPRVGAKDAQVGKCAGLPRLFIVHERSVSCYVLVQGNRDDVDEVAWAYGVRWATNAVFGLEVREYGMNRVEVADCGLDLEHVPEDARVST